MILFWDTETTGLPAWNRPNNDPAQPWIMQLAMLLTEDDGTERASISVIVQPGLGAILDPVAIETHGITAEVAARCGISSLAAVSLWDRFAGMARTLVAHNDSFDVRLMEIAWLRAYGPDKPSLADRHGLRDRFCTMRAATPVVNLPPTEKMLAAGFTKPKPPRLAECVRHFFNEDLVGAHDAMADVRACARVFFHLAGLERAA